MSERFLFDQHYRLEYGVIAGLDEAGRGPVAGPLVACAIVMHDDFDNEILNDSKKLTDRVRRQLKPVIESSARQISVGVVSSEEIDRNRMAWAVRTSFRRAMAPLIKHTDMFLVDGNSVSGLDVPVRFLVRGDSKSLSIAAASVIAKVTRDDMMVEAHRIYPQYGFDRHKGYGTAEHLKVIREIGPCPAHRMSFAPLSRWYQTGQMSLFPLKLPDTGKAAEQRAARFYRNLDFTVLERNWFSSSGEIDLILKKNDTVYFVEVKSSLTGREKQALQKIDAAKLARIRNAAEEWMTATGYAGECTLEAILVTADSAERIPLH